MTIYFFSIEENMAATLKLIKIIDEKTTYLVEIMNAEGEIKNEWMDNDAIKFLNPAFLDRLAAGSSKEPKNDAVVVDHNSLQCKECDALFKRRDHLKDHIRSLHAAEKVEYKCPLCPKSKFGYRSNFTQHMVRKHKWTSEHAKNEMEKAKQIVEKPTTHDEKNSDHEDDVPLAIRAKQMRENSRKRKATDKQTDATQPKLCKNEDLQLQMELSDECPEEFSEGEIILKPFLVYSHILKY